MKNNKVLVINHTISYSGKIKALMPTLIWGGNEPCLIAFNGTGRELERQSLSYKTPTDYMGKEDYAQLEEESIAFVKSLGSRKFDGDMSLIKLLEYEHISLWWVNEGTFWRHLVRDVIRYAGSLMRIIDEEKPGKIIIFKDDNLLVKVTIAIGRAIGIPVQTLSPGLPLRFKIALRPLLTGLKFRASPRLRIVRGILRKNVETLFGPAPQKGKKKKFLFSATMARAEEVVNPKSGKKWKESLYLGPVIRELKKDNANEMVFLYTFTNPFTIRVPSEVRWNRVTVRPWEYYLTWRILRTISEQSKMLKRKWKYLEGDPSFKELFWYKGVSLWDTLKGELRLRFYTYFPILINDIEISKKIIEIEDINIIVVSDQGDFRNKSLLVAAYPRKIPTLILQTGVMAGSIVFFEHGCAFGELDGSPSKRPLFPDKFSVYGDGSKDILKEARYPFYNSIIVTGQPRYDILARASEIYDGEKFRHDLNIAPGKKLVLITMQPSTTFANMEIFLKNILQALKDDPQIQIVIKPKPDPSDTLEKRYKQLAEEMRSEVIVLPRNSDTNEALYACDVLITFYSTVALEAMMLGKPVVTVNLTNQPDPVPYAQSDAALGVYKTKDIAPAVKKALDDPETRKRLESSRQKYLYKQCYKIDGQAAKRIVALIYKMIVLC